MPYKEKLFLSDYEGDLVTGIVAFLLTAMFLAYICLCCHVWGLHLRLIQLLRSIGANHVSQSSAGRGTEERHSISLPMPDRHVHDYLTPPPRYSMANDSLPTYSCALLRMLKLVSGSVHLRILVYVETDSRNNSVFSTSTPLFTQEDPSNGNYANSINCDHSLSLVNSNEVNLSSTMSNPIPDTTLASNTHVITTPVNSCQIFDSSHISSATSNTIQSPGDHKISSQAPITQDRTQQSNTENEAIPLPTQTTNMSTVSSPLHNTDTSLTIATSSSSMTSRNIYPATTSRLRPPTMSAVRNAGARMFSIGSSGTQSCRASPRNSIYRDAMNVTSTFSQENGLRREQLNLSNPLSSYENELPENSIRLFMKGIGGAEHVVYALKSTPNCYVAHWPMPSKELFDSEGLEVLVDGQPVENVYLEFLSEDGQRVGMAQLLPSPRSSVPSRDHSSNISLLPTPPPPPTPSSLLSVPPPYSP